LVTALTAVLALVAPVAAGQPSPTTRFVDDDGTAGANGCNGHLTVPKKIQPAVNHSNAGDTILVCSGDYPGFSIDDEINSPDGLTIRGVVPWAARVISTKSHPDSTVIRIVDVADTTIQWLTVLARTSQCGGEAVRNLIALDHGPGTQLRANHLGTLGNDTLGTCGYDVGIELFDSSDVAVAWNRIVDFKETGIFSEASSQPTVGLDLHGNTLRYFHAESAPLANDESIGILVFAAEGTYIAGNWIRSLPSAGQATPQLDVGIACAGCSGFEPAQVLRNRVLHVNQGISLGSLGDGSVVRGNRVRSSGEVGIHVDNMDNSTIEDNVVTDGEGDGIFLDDGQSGIPGFGPNGNTLQNNDFSNNAGTDCTDTTMPADNNWDDQTNLGDDANQDGLCNPGVVTP
jgi:parallel beta-helix repeat protein